MRKNTPHLLVFICVGNIHRSPIAEQIAKRLLRERERNDIEVCSRGILGTAGTTPPRHKSLVGYTEMWNAARPTLTELDVDLTQHISTPITQPIVEQASIIVAMEKRVLTASPNGLYLQFPEQRHKMRLFMELAGKEEDVPDCDGNNDEHQHRRVIETIFNTLTQNLDVLIKWT